MVRKRYNCYQFTAPPHTFQAYHPVLGQGGTDFTAQEYTECLPGIFPDGSVIAQYLTSGVKGQGEIWDYYKMWIEIW